MLNQAKGLFFKFLHLKIDFWLISLFFHKQFILNLHFFQLNNCFIVFQIIICFNQLCKIQYLI